MCSGASSCGLGARARVRVSFRLHVASWSDIQVCLWKSIKSLATFGTGEVSVRSGEQHATRHKTGHYNGIAVFVKFLESSSLTLHRNDLLELKLVRPVVVPDLSASFLRQRCYRDDETCPNVGRPSPPLLLLLLLTKLWCDLFVCQSVPVFFPDFCLCKDREGSSPEIKPALMWQISITLSLRDWSSSPRKEKPDCLFCCVDTWRYVGVIAFHKISVDIRIFLQCTTVDVWPFILERQTCSRVETDE